LDADFRTVDGKEEMLLGDIVYASIHFAVHHFGAPPGMPKRLFSRAQKQEMQLFFEFFTPKEDAI
jgi:hypothetical protein